MWKLNVSHSGSKWWMMGWGLLALNWAKTVNEEINLDVYKFITVNINSENNQNSCAPKAHVNFGQPPRRDQ